MFKLLADYGKGNNKFEFKFAQRTEIAGKKRQEHYYKDGFEGYASFEEVK